MEQSEYTPVDQVERDREKGYCGKRSEASYQVKKKAQEKGRNE
jgi:hypothetical protein